MNYLAHLSLAYPVPDLIAGNYITDLLTRKEEIELDSSFRSGILLHRWIDTFSNNNASLMKMNKEFHHLIHKYAPVATDIICDYLLCLSWEKYFDISHSEFSDFNYKILDRYSDLMPVRISRICNNMIAHRWLDQYQTLDGLEQVLKRTNNKTKFEVDLTLVLPVVRSKQTYLLELFNIFYDECKDQAKIWLNLQSEEKM